jgi:hypothetical protein
MEMPVKADSRVAVSERSESNAPALSESSGWKGPALSERSESKRCDNGCPTCYSPDACASRAVDLDALNPEPSSSSPVRP